MADELLRPSVIYTPAVLAGAPAGGGALHACAHITGGGIVGNLPRVLPEGLGAVLDRSAWAEPRVFAEIQRLGAVAEDEMDRVFNRGIGMALVVDAARRSTPLLDALGDGRAAGRRRSARSSAGVPAVSGSRERRRTRYPELRDHLLEHSVQDGGLHPQVGPQEQLVHRLQADGVPARGDAARGRRRALGDPAPRRPPSAGSPWAPTRSPSSPPGWPRRGVARSRRSACARRPRTTGPAGASPARSTPATRSWSPRTPSPGARRCSRRRTPSQEAGGEVVLLVAVVDRGGTVEAMAAAEGIPFRAVLTAPDLGFPYEGA